MSPEPKYEALIAEIQQVCEAVCMYTYLDVCNSFTQKLLSKFGIGTYI